MKKLFLFCFNLILFSSAIAQEETSDKSHSLKINLLGFAASNLSLQFEKSISDHHALLLQAGYSFPLTFPNSWFQIDNGSGTGSSTLTKKAMFTGGFNVTPEYRYYFKGEGSKGFYFGANLRYAEYGVAIDMSHKEDSSGFTDYNFKGKFKSATLGILIGNQWQFDNNFVLDWWILGLQFGGARVTTRAVGDFSNVDKSATISDISLNFGDVPLTRDEDIGMTDTDAHLNFSIVSVGIRTGLCIGFRF